MRIGWVTHPKYLEHDTGEGHPERADRLRAVWDRLLDTGQLDTLTALPLEPATVAMITGVHDEAYLDRVRTFCESGGGYLDPDTVVVGASYEAALLGSGGIVAAVDAVMGGKVTGAFCAARPPGHHAERSRAMGFCVFNHVAVAAERLIQQHGLTRVAIVDFDVHHGNGTQHIFEERADVLVVSTHEHPRMQYPGTGFAHERGRGAGEGATLNIPLLPGAGDAVLCDAFEQQVLPALDAFKPEFVLVSAGFDAHADDPLGGLTVSYDGFERLTRWLCEAAKTHCGGKLVSTLEGGYDLEALAGCVAGHVRVMGDTL